MYRFLTVIKTYCAVTGKNLNAVTKYLYFISNLYSQYRKRPFIKVNPVRQLTFILIIILAFKTALNEALNYKAWVIELVVIVVLKYFEKER